MYFGGVVKKLIKRATNKEDNTVESKNDLINNLIQLDCHNKLPKLHYFNTKVTKTQSYYNCFNGN